MVFLRGHFGVRFPMTTRITLGVGANLLGQHAAERNQDATAYVGNLDSQILQKSCGTMTTAVPKWLPAFVPFQSPQQADISPSTPLVHIVSYNILALSYVKSVYFPHSPLPPCLRWKNRSKAILERLLSFDADVLCLQAFPRWSLVNFEVVNMRGVGALLNKLRRGRENVRDNARDACKM